MTPEETSALESAKAGLRQLHDWTAVALRDLEQNDFESQELRNAMKEIKEAPPRIIKHLLKAGLTEAFGPIDQPEDAD